MARAQILETGVFVVLENNDWRRVYELIECSRQVDYATYERYKEYVANCPKIDRALPPLPADLHPVLKRYTISSLPATETPAKLYQFYLDPAPATYTSEESRRAVHDLVTFHIPSNLSGDELDRHLGESFRKTPFVVDFVRTTAALRRVFALVR